MSELHPTIYVVCAAAYHSNRRHGMWIDATQSVEEMQSQINDMLKASPIPGGTRYEIYDFDGFDTIEISEYESLDYVSRIARFLAECGRLGVCLIDYFDDFACARRVWEEDYCGCYPSQAAFVADWVEQAGIEIPKIFKGYIDYQMMARDWFISDFFSIRVQGQEHVFYQS